MSDNSIAKTNGTSSGVTYRGVRQISLTYAGAKYERSGKLVDSFENMRAAAAPVLREGVEFVRPGP